MLAKIYQPSRSAMQSGQAKTRDWVLEFVPADAKWIDPLMGWTGSDDMNSQVRLRFPTREEAVAYAESLRDRLRGLRAEEAPAHPAPERLRRQLRHRPPRRLDALTRATRAAATGPVAQPDRAPTF